MSGYLNGEATFQEDDFVDESELEDFIDDDDEELEDYFDDDEMEDVAELVEALEDYDLDDEDAEFLGPLIGAAAPALVSGLGSLFGRRRKGRRRSRRLRAVNRPMRALQRPASIRRSSFSRQLRGFATKNELKRTAARIDGKITALSRRTSLIDRRTRSVNTRLNATNKRLSTEVNRLRRADSSQQRGIRSLRKRDAKLAQDINNVRQMALFTSLLGGGEQEYEVVDVKQQTVLIPQLDAQGQPTGQFTPQPQLSEIQLKPKGDSITDRLPLLFSGGLGGNSGQGGIDPLLWVLLLDK